MTLLLPYFNGLLMCLGLIAAIGAQNGYVLSQGVKREHHWLVASICTLSDFALILLGALGLGAFIARVSWLEVGFYFLGAVFLAVYVRHALRDAWLGEQAIGPIANGPRQNARRVAWAALGFTWLNPHAWLDTTVLVGAFSAQYSGAAHWAFTLGAMSASLLWFFGLSLLASMLSSWLMRPTTWRLINLLIALIMSYIGIRFLLAAIDGLGRALA